MAVPRYGRAAMRDCGGETATACADPARERSRPAAALYDRRCTACPRLAAFRAESRRLHPHYWSAPVPACGDPAPRVLIVGLAPGLHGANRTGRPFTGDFAGILLYRTLHELGWASRPTGDSPDDGLRLTGVRITNAVKCVPPQNKPTGEEIRRCNRYLAAELAALSDVRVVVALGRIAHQAVLAALQLGRTQFPFAHGAEHRLGHGAGYPPAHAAGAGPDGRGAASWLLDSYHCSRYNTQTRRLTAAMFRAVLARARQLADAAG